MAATIKYSQIRDYIFHKVMQNQATEQVTDFDIAIAINTAQYLFCAQKSSPILTGTFEKELVSEGNTFTFDYHIKRVDKVYGYKDGSTDRYEITKQVFATPLAQDNKDNVRGLYQYQLYDNIILTGDNWKKIQVIGERYLEDIDNTDAEWDRTFELGIRNAGIVAEYCMGLISPSNLADGYNVAQFHFDLYNSMLRAAVSADGYINTAKNVRNEII